MTNDEFASHFCGITVIPGSLNSIDSLKHGLYYIVQYMKSLDLLSEEEIQRIYDFNKYPDFIIIGYYFEIIATVCRSFNCHFVDRGNGITIGKIEEMV